MKAKTKTTTPNKATTLIADPSFPRNDPEPTVLGPIIQPGMLIADLAQSDDVRGIVLAVTEHHAIIWTNDMIGQNRCKGAEIFVELAYAAVLVRAPDAAASVQKKTKREPFGEFAPCAREKLEICVAPARSLHDLEYLSQSADDGTVWEKSALAVEAALDAGWDDVLGDVKMINN